MGKYFAEVVKTCELKYFLNNIPNLKRIISVNPHSGHVEHQKCQFNNMIVVYEADVNGILCLQSDEEDPVIG